MPCRDCIIKNQIKFPIITEIPVYCGHTKCSYLIENTSLKLVPTFINEDGGGSHRSTESNKSYFVLFCRSAKQETDTSRGTTLYQGTMGIGNFRVMKVVKDGSKYNLLDVGVEVEVSFTIIVFN
jgi:hypothetical protein